MSILSTIAIYFVIWWTVLFVVLPFGIRRQPDDEVAPGTDPGAPAVSGMALKLLWNTILSAVLFVIGVLIYRSGVVNIDQLSDWLGIPF
jgi:predicted secreted protein